jgi:hypothetical protein
MHAKWPFFLITVSLLFGLFLTIANLERSSVMNNWTNRRCELPVVAAAMFFKPDSDPKSRTEFAKDNFDFCMKTYVDKFINLLLTPIQALFGKQMNVTSGAVDMLSTVRDIAQKLYSTLTGFLDQYYRRFNASVYEISRIVQYMRMIMRRINATVMSFLYSGITIFRGMLNSIQFFIKVILIICGIMIAIIIILIFILFPFIPLILGVLGAIVTTVMSLSMVMVGSIADQAEGDKGGFCFSKNTKILVKTKNGNMFKTVQEIKVGDELGNDCGKITAVIEMNGKDIKLYNLNGIFVSGSHLVKGVDGEWKSVSIDERANITDVESDILYCFNTTTHTIPIISEYNTPILFRDWEELSDDDEKGQWIWNYMVLKTLNKSSNYSEWKNSLKVSNEIPLLSKNTLIKTNDGFIKISDLKMSVNTVLDRNGKEQQILGLIKSCVYNCNANNDISSTWHTELYELKDGVWKKGICEGLNGNMYAEGITIITEAGEFIIWNEGKNEETLIRDFTDVGYKTIHETYPFVATRLRITERVH